MPKITIDGIETECRAGISVLQAALDAGLDVPHYCYHPGLSIVASCRLCLMEMQMRDPKTGEMSWSPKLQPACQTPVRNGLVVRFNSETVKAAREKCLEFLLLDHPLDCPVCDQAGQCLLQDYSERFGKATARTVEQKHVKPKKDVGPRTLLYANRCILCTRCIRFTDEISGTGELNKVNRGSRNEIDVFPGKPLDNPLQGNVVDLCPVGSLLDKDFLFKQRVWFLKRTSSICPGCSTGCAIHIDQNDNKVYRLCPRYNPGVNDWWICDEGRFGYKYIHDAARLSRPALRRGESTQRIGWEDVPEVVRFRFGETVRAKGGDKVALVLSPFMACEEAWLLIRFLRGLSADVMLVPGPVPTTGEDQRFPVGATGDDVKFTIRREKCPNRHGIELLIVKAGGSTATWAEFLKRAGDVQVAAAWITGGYPTDWVDKDLVGAGGEIGFLVVSDLFASKLTESASLVLPSCSFAERDGSFMNLDGKIQPFERAIGPLEGCKRDGQYLYEVAGLTGLYDAGRVREMMAEQMPEFAEVWVPPPVPKHQH